MLVEECSFDWSMCSVSIAFVVGLVSVDVCSLIHSFMFAVLCCLLWVISCPNWFDEGEIDEGGGEGGGGGGDGDGDV